MPDLSGKCVVLGVTGGIAAYKAAEIVSRLGKMGAKVRVVMTQNATRFITPITLQTLSGQKVHVDTFDESWEIGHIALAKEADLLLIAPATANILGKMAAGIADDLLSTTAMAVSNRAPILCAPAMNSGMWRSPANQQNIETLTRRGVKWVGPDKGHLACGDEDVGRMSAPEEIVEAACGLLLKKQDLKGKRILVTAGPTREMLDPVRFLSNRSTGRMGYEIAMAARDRGASVTLVSGPVALSAPEGVERVSILSTLDLYQAVVSRAPEMDAVIQAAAPADFRPKAYSERKIKKDGSAMTLELEPNPDIAAQLGRQKRPGQLLIAFAAETNDMLDNAQKKLSKKNADMVVANDVTMPGAGFEGATNQVVLIGRDLMKPLPMMSKRETADAILDQMAGMFE